MRIFPVLALGGRQSPFIETVIAHLRDEDLDVALERVPYEFQRGANQMMRIRSRAGAAT